MANRNVKIAVVEDSKIMINRIEKIILEVLSLLGVQESEYQLDLYDDGENVLDSKTEYHLVFLDIDLGDGIDGFEVGRRLNMTYKMKPLFIILTSFTDRGEDSSDIRAYWYLTKSSIEEKLHSVATIAIKEIIPTEGVYIKVNGEDIFLYFKHIRFIQRLSSSVLVYTVDSVFTTYKDRTISQWEKILPEGQFVTAHKSNIVGLEYIRKITKNGILMYHPQNIENVKIATPKAKKIAEIYDNYLLAKAKRGIL